MGHQSWAAIAICTVLLTSPALAADSQSAALAARARWHNALAAADEQMLEQLLSPSFSVIESSGTRRARAEVVARARLTALPITLTAGQSEVRIDRDVAIIAGPVTEQRGPTRITFAVTDVLQRAGGKWQVLTSHWTRMPDDLPEVQLSEAQLGRIVGRYRAPRGGTLLVERRGDRLAITEPSGQTSEFRAVSPTMIVGRDQRVRWLFIETAAATFDHAVIASQSTLTPITREAAK